MGQAKAKKDKEKKYEGMDFRGHLQTDANELVKDAEYLIENGVAKWQEVVFPDGTPWIALLFKPSIWELKDHRLTVKVPSRDDPK